MCRKRVLIVTALSMLLLVTASTQKVFADSSYLTLQRESITYEGENYYLKRRIHSVLFMGIDQWENGQDTEKTYRRGGQADFLLLLVFDDNAKEIYALPINRDTITPIKALNIFGQEIATQDAQLCLAFSYGDGDEESALLQKDAVSELLMGTEINHYYAMRLDGIRVLNDWLGGVEVALADDFSMYDPAMKEGETIRLTGDQAELFLRYRYGIGDSSNASRMQRQKEYGEQARLLLADKLKESTSSFADLLELLKPYSVTDMSYGYEINLANRLNTFAFQEALSIDGTSVIGKDGSNAFYPEPHSLMNALLACFYEKPEKE